MYMMNYFYFKVDRMIICMIFIVVYLFFIRFWVYVMFMEGYLLCLVNDVKWCFFLFFLNVDFVWKF